MLALIIGSLVMAMMGILIGVYYLKKGQFEDFEEVKYQMFREEEDE